MDQFEYAISFPESSVADANKLVQSLKAAIEDSSTEIKTRVMRESQNTMDFGTTLVIVLGTPAVTLAVKAIRDYLIINRNASIDIKDKNGHTIISNLTSRDAVKLTQELLKQES